MKKNAQILFLSLVFGLLFFQQDVAMNAGLFSLITILAVHFLNKPSRPAGYHITLVITTLASTCSVLYGNVLTNFAVLVSLSAFLSVVFIGTGQPLQTMKRSAYALCFGIPIGISHFWEKNEVKHLEQKWTHGLRVVGISIVSLIILLVFIQLYRASNSGFDRLLSSVNLSVIQPGFFFLCLFGFMLLSGFFYYRHFNLSNGRLDQLKRFTIGMRYETLFGYITISSLVFVLLVFIASEISYFLDPVVPIQPGPRLSVAVHDSIETLISSLILVIGISLFIFRETTSGKLPFKLTLIARLWLALNIIVAITGAIKNTTYIAEMGLTYKRIGVYYFLLISVIGLIRLIIKLNRSESNQPAYNSFVRFGYVILVVSALLPWNRWISEYNVALAIRIQDKSVINYTQTLGTDGLVSITRHWQDIKKMYDPGSIILLENEINSKVNLILETDWRSNAVYDYYNLRQLQTFRQNN